jgi:transketolase C-terminal domain/subunit
MPHKVENLKKRLLHELWLSTIRRTISRSAASMVGEDRVVFNIGQVAPVYDGNDFLMTPEGSSNVVRLAMRAAGVPDESCCCVEALPINVVDLEDGSLWRVQRAIAFIDW